MRWVIGLWLVLTVPLDSSAGPARTSKPLPATLFVERKDSRKLHLRTVAEALERALSEHRAISLTPINQLLEPLGSQLERLKLADERGRAGRAHLNNLEVEKALAALQQAVSLQEEVFHLFASTPSGIEDHAWLLVDLAVGHFLAGNEPQARSVLQRACVLVPALEYDATRLPPQMRRIFDEVKLLLDELGTGEAQIETRPAGAEVRANGKFVGFTPLRIRGMTAGRNLISVSQIGYHSQTVPIQVEGGELVARASVILKPVSGRPAPVLRAAVREARARAPSKSLTWMMKHLQRKVIFLATLESLDKDDVVKVEIFAFDGRNNRISAGVKATVLSADPIAECEELVAALVPFLLARKETRPKPADEGSLLGRLYRSPYFWPTVAGAIVIGASVGVGLYLGTREDPHSGRRLLIFPAMTHGH